MRMLASLVVLDRCSRLVLALLWGMYYGAIDENDFLSELELYPFMKDLFCTYLCCDIDRAGPFISDSNLEYSLSFSFMRHLIAI